MQNNKKNLIDKLLENLKKNLLLKQKKILIYKDCHIVQNLNKINYLKIYLSKALI